MSSPPPTRTPSRRSAVSPATARTTPWSASASDRWSARPWSAWPRPASALRSASRAPENDLTLDQGPLLFGRRLVGVIEGDADPHTFIPRLIALYREGRFPFDRLVEVFPVDRINEAVDLAHHGKVTKAVVTFR
nr:hypothetical protein [Streptomyces catenulae]